MEHNSQLGTDLEVVSHRLEGFDHDLEAGHGVVRGGADISDASTLNMDQVDLSKVPTQIDTSERSVTAAATPASEARDEENPSTPEGDNYLIRVKTEVRKKWSTNPRKGISTTTKYFYEELNPSWTVTLVIACFFPAGIIDAVAYQCWSTFVSMQTGNTILVAIRVTDHATNKHPLSYVKNLVSIGCYCLGCLGFNILHRIPSGVSNSKAPLHRWTLFLAFGLQSLLLSTAAILATAGALSTGSDSLDQSGTGITNYVDLAAIAVLAFEASGQVCISRVLLASDLPTIVISTLYHDFIAEMLCVRKNWRQSKTQWDFVVSQKKQIRRIASILCMFCGALVGGFVYRSAGGLTAALWTAAGTKMCICLAWCLWRKKIVMETVVVTEKPSTAK